MTPPKTTSEFLELAFRSGVLTQSAFTQHYPKQSTLSSDPQTAASELVTKKLLTGFQAKQLLLGRHKGFILGRCKILKPIGQGGMGSVYLAEDQKLKRLVAVKILPAEKANDQLTLERFLREARTAAALDHQNIVRVHDVNEGAGVQYLVMEYVEGTDLQSFISKTGALHYAQAVNYVGQVAAGLQHAHQAGFVHRDLKPSNLMLTKDGIVKVLDLGLARSIADKADDVTGLLGDPTEAAGTVDYASPEQALNHPVDGRSDIYSLGATFYALLTGHPPFVGNTTQKLLAHQTKDPPKLGKLRDTMPPLLVDVLAKMMAKSPDRRYQTAEELLEALSPWMPTTTSGKIPVSQHGQIADEPATRPQLSSKLRTAAPGQQKRIALYAGLGVAALLLPLLGYIFWPSSTPAPVAQGPSTAPNTNTNTVTPVPPPKVDNSPPAPMAPPPPKVAYEFSPAGISPLKRAFLNVDREREAFPKPWGAYTWKEGQSGEVEVADQDGERSVTIRNTRGLTGTQFGTYEPVLTLVSNTRYLVQLTYKTDAANSMYLDTRFGPKGTERIRRDVLPATNGVWRTHDIELKLTSPKPLLIVVENNNMNGQPVSIRNVKVLTDAMALEVAPMPMDQVSKQVARIDFDALQPLVLKKAMRLERAKSGEGSLPEGWEFYGSRGNVVAQYSFLRNETLGTIILQKHSGEGSAILYSSPVGPLKAGTKYAIRLEYRNDMQAAAAVELRQDKITNYENPPFQFALPSTGEDWEKKEFAITPIADLRVVIAFVTSDTSNTTGLHLRRFELVEVAP